MPKYAILGKTPSGRDRVVLVVPGCTNTYALLEPSIGRAGQPVGVWVDDYLGEVRPIEDGDAAAGEYVRAARAAYGDD